MATTANRPRWRIGYLVCCLVYIVWVSLLSVHDFEKVHREYRKSGERSLPSRVEETARQELIAECREVVERQGRYQAAECLSVPGPALEERRKAVAARAAGERSRAGRKLLFFYVSFVLLFLVVPPLVLYGIILLFIKVFGSVKVIKE